MSAERPSAWERLWRRAGPGPLAGYAFAVLCVALAIAARLALGLLAPDVVPFATLFPAVLAATLVGGAGPGLLALALGGLAAWYFVLPPRLTFAGLSTSDAVSLALYALSCGFLILLATALRRALKRARSAEAALDESEGRLLLAQEAAGIGAWDWDPEGGRDRWSAAQARLFGRDPAAGAPDHAAFMAYLHPDDRGRVDAALRAALAGGAAYDVEFRVRREDGAERWLLGRGRLLRDAGGRPVGMAGINMDVTERREAEERQRLLLQELAHRVKNTLAVVQGIANRSLSGDRTLAEAREVLGKRLGALAQAHSLLTAREWHGAALRAVLEAELRPYAKRAVLAGPDLDLAPKATLTLALVVHELATNAAKHGALSAAGGRVEVAWSLAGPRGGERLRLVWREVDGPPVAAPLRRGFGQVLIEQGWRYDLGGEVGLEFLPEGLLCRLGAPAQAVLAR